MIKIQNYVVPFLDIIPQSCVTKDCLISYLGRSGTMGSNWRKISGICLKPLWRGSCCSKYSLGSPGPYF